MSSADASVNMFCTHTHTHISKALCSSHLHTRDSFFELFLLEPEYVGVHMVDPSDTFFHQTERSTGSTVSQDLDVIHSHAFSAATSCQNLQLSPLQERVENSGAALERATVARFFG